MRTTEVLDRIPHLRTLIVTPDGEAHAVVEIRALEFGPVVALQSQSVDALLALAEVFKEAARRLQAAQIAAPMPARVA